MGHNILRRLKKLLSELRPKKTKLSEIVLKQRKFIKDICERCGIRKINGYLWKALNEVAIEADELELREDQVLGRLVKIIHILSPMRSISGLIDCVSDGVKKKASRERIEYVEVSIYNIALGVIAIYLLEAMKQAHMLPYS